MSRLPTFVPGAFEWERRAPFAAIAAMLLLCRLAARFEL